MEEGKYEWEDIEVQVFGNKPILEHFLQTSKTNSLTLRFEIPVEDGS